MRDCIVWAQHATFGRSSYVLEPSVSYNSSVFGSALGRPKWYPNIGLPAYIVNDGYLPQAKE